MLEGLTKYWGFYFVATPDINGVGNCDLRDALDAIADYSEWESDLERLNPKERVTQQKVNRQIASRHLRRALAARVVVFELFLQVAKEVDGSLQEKHKRIWLLFQISDNLVPSARNFHPFVRIMCLKCASSEALDDLLDRFGDILRDYLSNSHFIVGLDEAQWASRKYLRPFISSHNPVIFRSIIREITVVLTKLPIKLVLSGTGLSLEEVQDSIASGVSKLHNAVKVVHELGMFDTWEKLKPFLQRYIPASILYSDSGEHLQQRMRDYLQGR